MRWVDLAYGSLAKGSLLVGNGTNVATLPVAANGKVLTADSTAPDGVSWQTPASGGTPGGTNGQFQYNNAGAFAGCPNLRVEAGTSDLIITNDLGQRFVDFIDGGPMVVFSNPANGHTVATIYCGIEQVGWFGTVAVQQTANAALTDSTTGTPALTLVDVTTAAVADPAKCNDNFASVNAQLAAIRLLLTNYGLGA